MANEIAVTIAGRIHVVGFPEVQRTLNANEAIEAGDAVRIIPSGAGAAQFTKSNSTAGESLVYGIATRKVPAGQALTAIRKGKMSGWTFTQNYGTAVFLNDTDGRIGTVAGTVSVQVGRVVPTTANPRPDAEDKILEIDITV